jgi:signal transduction histidine kinase
MRFTLATKFAAVIVGVVVLAVASSVIALFSTRHIGNLMENTIRENLPSIEVAQELQMTLCEPRGLVASYMLDRGNKEWLQELADRKLRFAVGLAKARSLAHTPEEKESLNKLESAYETYDAKRDEVLTLFDKGESDKAKAVLLTEVNEWYMQAHDQCDRFTDASNDHVAARMAEAKNQVSKVSWIVGVAVGLTIGLGIALLWLFFHGVLLPLRQMVADAGKFAGNNSNGVEEDKRNELHAVGNYLRLLMSNVSDARSDLKESRNQLIHAESQLASVGKLAASVAHEIRNPLAAISLCLQVIRQVVGTNAEAHQKLDMTLEEIARLDNIIKHFLEFSRPPHLHIGPQKVKTLFDKIGDLLQLVLAEKSLRLSRDDSENLPMIAADAEQIKQVLINVVKNAAEATPAGGEIRLTAREEMFPNGRLMVVIRIEDNGPGIPANARERIFEPFFTTKETGTGLGLCIAARVMAQHEGRLALESSSDR